MGKVKKSFKKFSQTKLKQTIERRRSVQKIVKDRKKREVKKLNRSLLEKATNATAGQQDDLTKVGAFHTTVDKEADRLADMSMDDFINGGFDNDDEQDNSSSEEEDNDDDLIKGLQHKKDLEKLKEQDPEFYEYLKNNDKSLLEFDVSEDEDEDGEDEEDEDEDEVDEDEDEDEEIMDVDDNAEDEVEASSGVEVTKAMLNSWEKAIVKDHSLSSGKKLMLAFRAAVLSGQQDINSKDSSDNHLKAQQATGFIVNNDIVFNKAITLSLQLLPNLFAHHLPLNPPSKRSQPLPSSCQKWATVSPLVKGFLSNLLSTLRYVTEPTILQYVLQESEKSIVYFLCFPKLATAYLKALLTIWGTGHESTRMLSFVCIRRLSSSATTATSTTLLDVALKGVYTMFVKVCKDTNIHTLPAIETMMRCIVDLLGIRLDSSYQHAFLYIRQLAIHLRNAISAKTKEAYRSVYNWQFIHCLRLWSLVLSTYCNQRFCANQGATASPLQPIIYPFVQVALGASRLIPTAQYFPLRLHCIDLLIQLGRNTDTFIPLVPAIFEMLESTPKEYLHTRVYQEVLMERICESIVQLKRANKRIHSVKLVKQSQSLIEKLEQQSKYIEEKRSAIDFSPNQLSKAHTFLASTPVTSSPLGAHVASMRKIKEQRQQVLAQEASDKRR
ncbi:Noc2p family-domain-containing protein [Syncephalis fuscata]|nr:Noc2p family-domain-containing protein [Syncephalis fuscata]